MKKVIFSGVQPTGRLHLGNYLGAVKQWVELQEKWQGIFCLVDYHAITVDYNPKELPQITLDTVIDLLALGIDPQKSILFIQSQVPEHTELAWILNTLVPISELKRMTQFKQKAQEQGENPRAGLLNYPVLMAADILLYKAIGVPVGEDQAQHVELTRLVARKFNQKFGETFPLPKTILSDAPRIKSLHDPTKKMSNTYGPHNCLLLSDSPEVIKNKLAKAVTDVGKPVKGAKSPGVENLFTLLKIFSKKEKVDAFEKEWRAGQIRYQKLKEVLAQDIANYLARFRQARKKWERNPEEIKKILEDGRQQAHKIAQKTLEEVKKKMGFELFY